MDAPVILYNPKLLEPDELRCMSKHFACYQYRSHIPAGSRVVIARHSCWPNYEELDEDIRHLSAKEGHVSSLINNVSQNLYICDLGNWYRDLIGLTPETWTSIDEVPWDGVPDGVVIKGQENSKKFLWDTHMFARDRTAAINVMCNLQNDGLIGDQRLYFRRFEKLKTYLTGFRGMPVTHEYRVFVAYRQVLTKAFYWSNYWDDVKYDVVKNQWGEPPDEFLNEVIKRIGGNANFYVIDAWMAEDGRWWVGEINDGQRSGLSLTDPDQLYSRLRERMRQVTEG